LNNLANPQHSPSVSDQFAAGLGHWFLRQINQFAEFVGMVRFVLDAASKPQNGFGTTGFKTDRTSGWRATALPLGVFVVFLLIHRF
jgi:hypothetical protein